MKKTSKTWALIIACAMIFGITSCNKEEKTSSETTTEETTTVAEEETSEEETEPEETETSEETTEETTEPKEETNGDYLKDLSLATTSKPIDCDDYRDYVLNQNASSLKNGILMHDDSEKAGQTAMNLLSGQDMMETNSKLFNIDKCISSAAYYMLDFDDGSRSHINETFVVMEYSSSEEAKGVFEGLVKNYTDLGLDLSNLKPEEYSIEDNKGNFVMVMEMASEEKLNSLRDKLIESGMSEEEADEIIATAKEASNGNVTISHFYFVDNRLFYAIYMTKDQNDFKTVKYLEELGFADPFTVEPSDEWNEFFVKNA